MFLVFGLNTIGSNSFEFDRRRKRKMNNKSKKTVNRNIFRTVLTVIGVFVLGLTHLHGTANAQGSGKSAPVVVTNTTANPVPVTGGVAVTNSAANPVPVAVTGTPVVNASQNGTWNVGIAGTPTVKIDPDANTIKLPQKENIANVESFNWTGQQSVFSFQWAAPLDKIRVCVANGGLNTVVANINTVIGTTQFNLDQFQVSQNVVCRVFDAPGSYLYVTVYNTGANNTGNVRVGYWGLY
jgi:hypothetical protein